QMFSANGSPINGNIPIDTSLDQGQNDPVVAIHEDGSFVVAWEERLTPSGSEIHARRYGTNGNPLGSPFRVNTDSQTGTYNPAIATTPDGGFLVAWEGSDNNDIFVRRFDDNGVPQTGEILVNTFIPNAQNSPAIAVDNFGNFVVVWDSEDQDQSEEGIYARRFQADGTPLSEELLVNTTTLDSQYNPDIAMRPNGDFVVTWTGDSNNGSDIYAQQFQIASQVTFEQAAVHVQEGRQAVFTLNRLNDLQLTSRVQVNVAGGSATAGVDYTFTPQTITFNPGETQKTITIPILRDAFTEGRETIQFSITGGDRASLGNTNTATITILDDETITGTNRRDILTGTAQNEMLVGLRGNDTLRGGRGNDTLIGVDPNAAYPGRGEIDRLLGGPGRDVMVLGDETRAFYDDGQARGRGLQDYALIRGFNPDQDKIQLSGSRERYVLGSVPNMVGTGIFRRDDGTRELIGVVQGSGALNLNSNTFQFVEPV
ncbi:MAG TPA: Calx-beta domain-containing protein, partial [Candidatus Obscuribacterales bacterium]